MDNLNSENENLRLVIRGKENQIRHLRARNADLLSCTTDPWVGSQIHNLGIEISQLKAAESLLLEKIEVVRKELG